MRAARYHGRRDIRVEDIPIPEAGPGQYLIEVDWCGICGSDLHEYMAGMVLAIPKHDCPCPCALTSRQTIHHGEEEVTDRCAVH
jgi:(R,R)-butanediol dehydrogenase/meso-butanediol dehydrogenase/diacetyl reductase